ncbi:IS1182 family transposase [Facklamia sp. DSM 111018]|uniref:IS1182 family transposase n=1 Tax=Facklamia lactis TaxID=2749967 RepID=A0ABS0LN65_9LACT|nr:IS1182 family transposase [Facklamia lactis]MBG9979753.1 IS1182 family transposase [Facklamia lactis]MBG9985567.1 IS1182 family transposase [Facklamia lactis]
MYPNYNINQLTLELSTQYSPKENHVVWVIYEFVESLNLDHVYTYGRPKEYDPSMLLKILLYAYSRGIFSSRAIEQFAQENLPARWLTQEAEPSYRTLCRFRVSQELRTILTQSFDDFTHFLKQAGFIDDIIFIDGTKILADANKYSFVWKKNTMRYEELNRQQIVTLINDIHEHFQQAVIPEDTDLTLDELEEVLIQLEVHLEQLEAEIAQEPRISPHPKKKSHRKLKRCLRQLRQRQLKKRTCILQKERFGERNSYSKTDTDATFMRMKEDSMKNGQLKPGYNLQVATREKFFLAYQLFPNPTDTRTFIPFLQTHSSLVEQTQVVAADAGYGSEANYRYLEDVHPQLTAIIPYNTYIKEQSKRWQTDDQKIMNWAYVESDDYYVDPQGVRFNFHAYRTRTDKYGFERQFTEYVAETKTIDQMNIEEAFTAKGYKRRIQVNPEYEYFKAKQRQLLSDDVYGSIYHQRKIDVEPAFSHLKACLGFIRFHVRGIDRVNNEIGLALMASNLRRWVFLFTSIKKIQNYDSLRIIILGILETYVTASYFIK